MSQRFLIVYCGLLMTISAFSTDVVLPAFGLMAKAFASPIEQVQMAVPVYLLGLGLSQIYFGPASDRHGRRPAMLTGLAVYIAGTVLCLLAPTNGWVLAGRLVQGFGGGAGQVIARAIVRDRFSGTALAQSMALVTAIFAIGPILAPLVGYSLTAGGHWQGSFLAMLAFAGILLAMALRSSETLERLAPDALAPKELARRARRVLGHPQSRHFLILSGIVMTTIMSYLTNAPRLYVETLGTSQLGFVVFFAISGLGIIVGQLTNRRLIARFGTLSASVVGACVLVAASASIMLIELLVGMTPVMLCACMFAFNTSYLVVFANSISLILDPHGDIAGFTASFAGFTGPIIAASLVVPLTFIIDGRVAAWGAGMVGVSALCLVMLLSWRPIAALGKA